MRRLGLRALCRAKKLELKRGAGPNQYGVGRDGGANLLVKCLKAQVEARPTATSIKVDLRRAFQTMHRQHAFRAIVAADAEMATVLADWYAEPATHVWRNADGEFSEVASRRGF